MEKDAWNNDSPTSAKGQEEQAAPQSCCSTPSVPFPLGQELQIAAQC